MSRSVTLGNCTFEVLTRGEDFLGLGAIAVNGTRVRSGRLPLRPHSQTFTGLELARLRLLAIDVTARRIRIRTEASFRRLFTKLMWDHSTDPIHETGDWDTDPVTGTAELDLILEPARDAFGGVTFAGFSYRYAYRSRKVPLFFLYDRASWELDGDITGATVISQSACSDPVVAFSRNTAWTTEGLIPWVDANSLANPVMTHNLPRWASHQAFDYQHKGGRTLLGVFEHVDLIRSVLRREPGKPELKVFDKYIFDQTLRHTTPRKAILLNTEKRSAVGQQNLWTWVFDEVHGRARAEFGLHEEPLRQRVNVNYWVNFTMDSYYRDLLPAAAAIGAEAVFIDNLKKSNLTARLPYGNMCCSHEFEIAPELGGPERLKLLVEQFAAKGITIFSWTNPSQSCTGPLFYPSELSRKLGTRDWYIRLADTRSPYCGAYIPEGAGWDLTNESCRRYFVDCHKRIKAETGHSAYLWDSFYNSAFMPVSFANGKAHTCWRGVLQTMKELQDAGIHCMIESFGPFGEVQHGCVKSYNLDNLFVCYKILLGTGYTTIPSGVAEPQPAPYPLPDYYRILAHMSKPDLPLYFGGKRIDDVFTVAHRQALADYNRNRQHMHRRFLQEDGKAVIWHDAKGKRATIFNFAARSVRLPGKVTDLTVGQPLPRRAVYKLEALHTYAITGTAGLPVSV